MIKHSGFDKHSLFALVFSQANRNLAKKSKQ